MQLAQQLNRLGTETAFAVSAMAAHWQAQGNRVFPFHLGDISVPPPPELLRATRAAVDGDYHRYCPGAGLPLLREQLARALGQERGVEFSPDNIAVQPGGKPVIGKFLGVCMNPGDEVLYPVPGFPIYRSQIDYQGGVAVPYFYRADASGFALDLDSLKRAITPKTRALIYNNHHNPTGATAESEEIAAVAELALGHDLWVLSDEAYANIRFDDSPLRSVATRDGMRERCVILFTCSKQFAMTGWRVGAAVAPAEIIAQIATFNTNLESCTTHFIQQALGEVLRDAEDWASLYAPIVAALGARRDALLRALAEIDGVKARPPRSGFYVYADIGEILARKRLPDAEALMRESLCHTGLSFCTGAHFGENSDTHHIRLAFSGIDTPDIQAGMANWKTWLET